MRVYTHARAASPDSYAFDATALAMWAEMVRILEMGGKTVPQAKSSSVTCAARASAGKGRGAIGRETAKWERIGTVGANGCVGLVVVLVHGAREEENMGSGMRGCIDEKQRDGGNVML